MSIQYIKEEHYNEFKKLIETVCPYKLEIFKYENSLYFHQKWLYCKKFNRRERFKELKANCILNDSSYALEIYRGIANISQYIKTYEGDDFEDYKERSRVFYDYLYEVDTTFLNIIKEAKKILEHQTKINEYENITEIIIYFFSSILCFKAEHEEYINVTKPIKDENTLEELDSFIILNSEELYINIMCTKCC